MRWIFLKVLTFKSVLSVSDGFQGLSPAFRYPLQLLTFTSLKLVILKMFTETLLCDWSMFSGGDLSLA
jgi:hypothetical protein